MIYLKDVVSLSLQKYKCNGCGMCTKVCPHKVFEIKNGKAQIIKRDHCMECGACAKNCQRKAISVNSGVGCAAGIMIGILNNTEPSCGCDSTKPDINCGC